ncbi:hypothetical protein OKW21_000242 [Catalinimonas alkaloidigena]|uniref:hypothetical protein n=1 Tax=Catalinimonas alkaloidigena TaxID=1075417 RepID=UPI002404FFAF|nr:hypothetical protein [Catalinimonas alkaloidigena]MDF9794979.1 hypothetical protein [Catalinimonas alkaloidigena]
MRTHYTTLVFLFCLTTLLSLKGNGQSVNQESSNNNIVDFHTRLVIASPNHTFSQVETINYDYSDYKAANIGGSLKVQFFDAIYGEYALLFNLYSQRTSQFYAGIETPSKGIRLGVRYLFSNDQLMPVREDGEGRDLQMYITLGGAKGGLEIALGNINKLLSSSSTIDPIALTDVQVRLNMALWSSRK